jgi:hypothetical protein
LNPSYNSPFFPSKKKENLPTAQENQIQPEEKLPQPEEHHHRSKSAALGRKVAATPRFGGGLRANPSFRVVIHRQPSCHSPSA